MAQQPTSRTIIPPPDLPNMPDVSTTLSAYLRNFSLWCRNGFADKVSATQAAPGVLLLASDAPPGTTPKVFMIEVDSAGVISARPIGLGGGQP